MKLFVLAILLFAGCHWGGKKLCMVGDSHMKHGKWDSLGVSAYNFGVGGETIAGSIQQARRLRMYKPNICFIECGINDIGRDSTYEHLKRDYNRLLDTMSTLAIPVAVKVLYLAKYYPDADTLNSMVTRVNTYIDSLGIATIDINMLVSANGYLKDEYCGGDGIHLNDEGYKLFAQSVNCWLYRREMDKWYNKLLLR